MLSAEHTAGEAAEIRSNLGLPATDTDFSDASGLAELLSNGVSNFVARNDDVGAGALWRLKKGDEWIHAYLNWVDGVFFATALGGFRPPAVFDGLAPFVFGVPSGSNPTGTVGTWTGHVVGRVTGVQEFSIGDGLNGDVVDGIATLTYDFTNSTLDVVFSKLRYPTRKSKAPLADKSWSNLAVSDGVFGDCTGTGDCIRGRFFKDHKGTAARSVGGVFRYGEVYAAFGAQRKMTE